MIIMLISWVEKFSMIDYPGKVACIIFTAGCNLRCGYCHNSDFVLPEKLKEVSKNLISQEAFFNFLSKRQGLLDWVSICGWEPTLQKDLVQFCERVKWMWFDVKLDTNGRDPELLEYLINNGLVDYIAMDIKAPFEKLSCLTWVEEDIEPYKQSIDILLQSSIDYEFRSTIIKGQHSHEDIKGMVEGIQGAKNYYLQNYRSGNTLDPVFQGESFTIVELQAFKSMAENYVKNIWIRN